MSDFQLKYEKLDPLSKREVDDFIDFLLQKTAKKEFDMTEYRKRILDIPTWAEEDVKEFEVNTKHLKS